jgi:hypothetical protein
MIAVRRRRSTAIEGATPDMTARRRMIATRAAILVIIGRRRVTFGTRAATSSVTTAAHRHATHRVMVLHREKPREMARLPAAIAMSRATTAARRPVAISTAAAFPTSIGAR